MQACQHNNETGYEIASKKGRLNQAAAYNTQLGLAYLKQGNRVRAKRKLLLALEQAPNDANVNAAFAYFMEKSGELDKATVYYKKAMLFAPKEGGQLNNYGAFLCRQGQYKQAEPYFLEAIKDMKYEHTAGAYENAGLCAAAIPDNEKAIYFFNKALEEDPSRGQSLYEIVKIELKGNNTNQALAYLQKYPELSLSDPNLLKIAVNVAHKAEKKELEAYYEAHYRNFSEKTGGNDDYNRNN
jgi:type IV pilus assembly protein PilF